MLHDKLWHHFDKSSFKEFHNSTRSSWSLGLIRDGWKPNLQFLSYWVTDARPLHSHSASGTEIFEHETWSSTKAQIQGNPNSGKQRTALTEPRNNKWARDQTRLRSVLRQQPATIWQPHDMYPETATTQVDSCPGRVWKQSATAGRTL